MNPSAKTPAANTPRISPFEMLRLASSRSTWRLLSEPEGSSEQLVDGHRAEEERQVAERSKVEAERSGARGTGPEPRRQRHERRSKQQRRQPVDRAEQAGGDRDQAEEGEHDRVDEDLAPRLALAPDHRQ